MEAQPHSPENLAASSYKLLTTDNYLDLISDREGVDPTETIARGDSEGMRAKYVQNTERLIDTIHSGFTHEPGATHTQTDTVFYLDKSARPVAWLVDAFWDVFPDEQKRSRPSAHFLNLHAPEGPGGGRPSLEQVRQAVASGEFDTYIAQMREVYPDMTDKNILVVDEVSVSGSTEELGYQVFRKAFPDAHIKSAAWMQAGKRYDRAGNSFPMEIPVWYKKNSASGRAVDNINPEKSLASPSAAQRAGANILSTLPETPDLEAVQMRREFKQLAADVKSGKQSIIPDGDPDDSRYHGFQIRTAPTSDGQPKRPLFES